jgi:hypothetical protein
MAVRIISALRDPVRGRWSDRRKEREQPIPASAESAVA